VLPDPGPAESTAASCSWTRTQLPPLSHEPLLSGAARRMRPRRSGSVPSRPAPPRWAHPGACPEWGPLSLCQVLDKDLGAELGKLCPTLCFINPLIKPLRVSASPSDSRCLGPAARPPACTGTQQNGATKPVRTQTPLPELEPRLVLSLNNAPFFSEDWSSNTELGKRETAAASRERQSERPSLARLSGPISTPAQLPCLTETGPPPALHRK